MELALRRHVVGVGGQQMLPVQRAPGGAGGARSLTDTTVAESPNPTHGILVGLWPSRSRSRSRSGKRREEIISQPK
jgi:hypothetical protein